MNAHVNPALAVQATDAIVRAERSAYRRSRGGDSVATIAALLVGLMTVGAFALIHPTFAAKEKREPTVVTLLSLPEDPPPADAPPPEQDAPPPRAEVAAPVPLVAVPQQPVLQAPPVVAPVAQPAPPRPAPAAPAPVAKAPENLGELAAKVVFAKPLKYPLDSRRLREEGVVVLSVLLAVDGRVSDISVARSSGFPRLDRAALDGVRDWRWSPLVRDGNPVMVRGVVTIPFVLQRGGGRHGRGGHDHDRDRDRHRDQDGGRPADDGLQTT